METILSPLGHCINLQNPWEGSENSQESHLLSAKSSFRHLSNELKKRSVTILHSDVVERFTTTALRNVIWKETFSKGLKYIGNVRKMTRAKRVKWRHHVCDSYVVTVPGTLNTLQPQECQWNLNKYRCGQRGEDQFGKL